MTSLALALALSASIQDRSGQERSGWHFTVWERIYRVPDSKIGQLFKDGQQAKVAKEEDVDRFLTKFDVESEPLLVAQPYFHLDSGQSDNFRYEFSKHGILNKFNLFVSASRTGTPHQLRLNSEFSLNRMLDNGTNQPQPSMSSGLGSVIDTRDEVVMMVKIGSENYVAAIKVYPY